VDDREQQEEIVGCGGVLATGGGVDKISRCQSPIRSFPFFSLYQQIVNVKFHRRGSCLPLFHVSCPLRRVHSTPHLLCFSSQMTDAATRRRTGPISTPHHGGSDLSSAAHQLCFMLACCPMCLMQHGLLPEQQAREIG
jgi:hypothetical protein